jgi:hypothetical protein
MIAPAGFSDMAPTPEWAKTDEPPRQPGTARLPPRWEKPDDTLMLTMPRKPLVYNLTHLDVSMEIQD